MEDLQMACHMQTTGTHVSFNGIFRIVSISECNREKKKRTKEGTGLLSCCDIGPQYTRLWISDRWYSMVCVRAGIQMYSCDLCYLHHSVSYTIVMYNMCKQTKYTVLLSELPSYSSFQVLLSHSPIRHLFAYGAYSPRHTPTPGFLPTYMYLPRHAPQMCFSVHYSNPSAMLSAHYLPALC